MIPNPGLISDILTDVITRGAAVVDKRKLILALGAKQDRPSVWGRLLDAWEDLDEARSSLRAVELWGVTLVLAKEDDLGKQPAFASVADWAA